MKAKHLFIAAIFLPIAYMLLWLLASLLDLKIADQLYDAHFFLLWLTLPWGFLGIELSQTCNEFANTWICNSISLLLLSLGLAINTLTLWWISSKLFAAIKPNKN
ncbi:hypothetical protein [Motilimonas eburnea]|uniref:hypothetical protein n=1 Tax=Motilimonas eburnea TaxID=1737488 RepID=UPI001E5C07F9|nr:hypothetical protein [Motilimonas eburnea]MCE2571206.1 hypothetical protein [Motilimonas eburnea]